MISNYETTVKINQQNIDELDKLIETVDDMVSYLKSIGVICSIINSYMFQKITKYMLYIFLGVQIWR